MALVEIKIRVDLDPVIKELLVMSEALDRLTASVEANQSATDSVLALVATLAGEIRANVNDADALNALADKLDAENTTIAAAVTANTVPAPTTDPMTTGA